MRPTIFSPRVFCVEEESAGARRRPMELPTNLLARICEKVCNGRMPNQTAMCTRALVGLEGGSAIPGIVA